MTRRVETLQDRVGDPGRLLLTATDRFGMEHDLTFVRGVPTIVDSFTTTDPFGPGSAQFSLPRVTFLDRFESDELPWYAPGSPVDLYWQTERGRETLWEGHMVSFDATTDGVDARVSVSCVGAMLQLDDFVAKPMYLPYPISYEEAIRRAFPRHTRLAPLSVVFPDWWDKRYREADWADKELWRRPRYMAEGQLWTGMLTRSTGTYDTVLNGYVQQLLSSMHTPRGQWTLMLDPGRVPVLRHRDNLTSPGPRTLVVDVASPGVKLRLQKDYSQRVDMVYGKGKTLSGLSFTSMEVQANGVTTYVPFASLRSAYPQTPSNMDFRPRDIRREVVLDFTEGLSESEAREVARYHLQTYAEAGLQGNMTLSADVYDTSGALVPRHRVRAGMSLWLNSAYGQPGGVTVHATETTYNPQDDSVSITFDSKFRDRLTVAEVMMRGRDAMTPIKLITPGSFAPPTPDALMPWDEERSGFVPEGSHVLYNGAPDDLLFPWESWTRAHPPSSRQWQDCYIKIPAANRRDSSANWSRRQWGGGQVGAHSVLMAQAGKIRLVQIAAYDKDGKVMKVPFHVSLYTNNGVSWSSMPRMLDEDAKKVNEANAKPPFEYGTQYSGGQRNPFFPGAWERYNDDGTLSQNEAERTVHQSAGFVVGWGSAYERAGFVPGTQLNSKDRPTGLLADETGFTFDTSKATRWFDPYRAVQRDSLLDEYVGRLYVLVFCDAHNEDVYFHGRIYVAPPDTVA